MSKTVKSINRYEGLDVYPFKNEVEWHGFDKNMSFGEMVNLAINNDCNLITKNGVGGKWYLKRADYEEAKNKLHDGTIGIRQRYICYLIEYTD